MAETVKAVIGAGAAGVNLEDGLGSGGVRDAEDQCRRLSAAREAAQGEGIPLFINARIDVYLLGSAPEPERFGETVRRARAYLQQGADGIFVPGILEPRELRRLAEEIDGPLNVMAGAGSPSIA